MFNLFCGGMIWFSWLCCFSFNGVIYLCVWCMSSIFFGFVSVVFSVVMYRLFCSDEYRLGLDTYVSALDPQFVGCECVYGWVWLIGSAVFCCLYSISSVECCKLFYVLCVWYNVCRCLFFFYRYCDHRDIRCLPTVRCFHLAVTNTSVLRAYRVCRLLRGLP